MIFKYSQRQARLFREHFKVELSVYWLPFPLGFDVIRFDDDVVKSGNMSMKDAVRQTYGVEAVKLCQELLGMQS